MWLCCFYVPAALASSGHEPLDLEWGMTVLLGLRAASRELAHSAGKTLAWNWERRGEIFMLLGKRRMCFFLNVERKRKMLLYFELCRYEKVRRRLHPRLKWYVMKKNYRHIVQDESCQRTVGTGIYIYLFFALCLCKCHWCQQLFLLSLYSHSISPHQAHHLLQHRNYSPPLLKQKHVCNTLNGDNCTWGSPECRPQTVEAELDSAAAETK